MGTAAFLNSQSPDVQNTDAGAAQSRIDPAGATAFDLSYGLDQRGPSQEVFLDDFATDDSLMTPITPNETFFQEPTTYFQQQPSVSQPTSWRSPIDSNASSESVAVSPSYTEDMPKSRQKARSQGTSTSVTSQSSAAGAGSATGLSSVTGSVTGSEDAPKRGRGRPKLQPSTGDGPSKPGERVPHTQVERKYRETLNKEMERLREALPTLPFLPQEDGASGPKPKKATILATAVNYIKFLENEYERLDKEIQELKRDGDM
ncbi:hypothetical protein BDY21DRAFT_61211 [Lineolata rhizophorae]|uniref:BHLH domain-containing protein n=1 Tax=Lineolata rhizophorae TaxID=578093 RepID=A0A6A6NVQ7_9PEZI|nr:hypothetical protein BDY21DRAFT_61211 [Lineolata rhizophorae]